MLTRRFALIVGVIYLLVGIGGFIPGLANAAPSGSPSLTVDFDYNFLAGTFPINVLHNIVHILIGLAGIATSTRLGTAKNFARGLAVLYLVLGIMGMIPGLNTMFGLVPLFNGDVVLHLLTAAVAAYFGFVHRDRESVGVTGTEGAARPVRRVS